jgi:hypothetical protein
MKNSYIILLVVLIIFNPTKNLFGQNLNYSFFHFDQITHSIITDPPYFTTIPNDPNVIHWNYLIAGYLPLWIDGLGNDPIMDELSVLDAEYAAAQAATMWHNSQPAFEFNTAAPEGSNSIQIKFDDQPDDFGGTDINSMLGLMKTTLQGDFTSTEFRVTNMTILVNACPNRYDINVMGDNIWKWTTNWDLPADSSQYYDFQSALIHEYGHLLGINHCNDYLNIVMYPILYRIVHFTHLYSKDIQALNYLFHETFDPPGIYTQPLLQTNPQINFMTYSNNEGVKK